MELDGTVVRGRRRVQRGHWVRDAIRDRALSLAREAAVAMYAHRSAAEAWAWARYGLGVPAAVLAGLAGYFALGEDTLG
jgi:hypothetical protein